MKKFKLIYIFAWTAFMVMGTLLVHDYLRPNASEAQTCVGLTCQTYSSGAPGVVSCPAGTQMTGGGVHVSGDNEPDWIRSYPAGNGWGCDVQQQNGTCYVRCCTLG